MHFVSRSLKIAAGALIVLLLASSIGWLTRHAWIPGLVNSQLDGVRLTELQGLHLSRAEQELGAQVQHLRLVTRDQITIDLSGIFVSNLPALVRSLLSANTKSPPAAKILIERLVFNSPELSAAEATGDAGSTEVPGKSTGSPLPQKTDTATPTQPDTALSISDALDGLRRLPIRALQIQHILWPDKMDGELSLSASQTPQRVINGALRSDRCGSCRLEMTIQTEASQLQLASQQNLAARLYHDDKTIAQLDSKLQLIEPDQAGNSPGRWQSDSNFQLSAAQLPLLLQQVGLSAADSGDWFDIARSLNGNIELTIHGEIPDRIVDSSDFRDISAVMEARNLSVVLPEAISGLPLTAQISSTQPLNLRIHSLTPLSLASIAGNLHFRIDLPPASEPSGISYPLLSSSVELSTEGNIPNVVFRGETRLEQASRLWSTQKWQHLRHQFPVTKMQGAQRFSGAFTLPGLDGLLRGSETPRVRQFMMEVSLEDDAKFQLELPKDNNPLAAINGNKLQARLSSKQPVKISAAEFPGRMDLEIPQLSLAATVINRPGSSEKTPDIHGELGQLRCTGLPEVDCTLKLNVAAPALQLPDTATGVKNLNLSLAEARVIDTNSGSPSIVLRELNLTSDQVISGEISVNKPELFAQQAECLMQGGTLSCESPQLALNLDPLSNGDNEFRGVVFLEELSVVHHQGKPESFQAASRFHTDNANIHALKQYKADFSARGQWQFKNQQISGNSDITGGPLALGSTWQHNLRSGKGALTLKLPSTEFAPKNALSQALRGLPVDIVGGSLQAQASLYWPQSENSQLHLTLADTALQYNDSFAVGINAQVALQQKAGNWVTTKPVPVSVNAVDAGIAVNNLHFVLSLTGNGDLTLGNFSAELLEGALTADMLIWNLNGKERHSRLQFTGLSIGALAKEMESTNFAASGLLDASIPITTDRQGVTVDNGTIQSRPPGGRLRYYGAFSPGMLGSNPQLKLLAGALEDYNYRDISGTMSYPLSGDLKLNLKLVGRSAAIDANRDLIINLNLENNVPSMLRSLQASRDLTDVLERQVQ